MDCLFSPFAHFSFFYPSYSLFSIFFSNSPIQACEILLFCSYTFFLLQFSSIILLSLPSTATTLLTLCLIGWFEQWFPSLLLFNTGKGRTSLHYNQEQTYSLYIRIVLYLYLPCYCTQSLELYGHENYYAVSSLWYVIRWLVIFCCIWFSINAV